jgi:plastocyanin
MRLHRHFVPVALLFVGTVLAAGCKDNNNNGGGGGGTPNATIEIDSGAFNKGNMAFSLASTTVHVGNVVRMHNGDSITHNIQADTGSFPSWGSLGPNAGSNVTATAQGTFGYHCVVGGHTMTGTLVVVN